MSITRTMADTAIECARTPGRISIWSDRLGKYVCRSDPDYQRAVAERASAGKAPRPSTSAAFKLVFLTAAGGTLLFVGICVATMIIAGGNPQPLAYEIIRGLFALAQIGFGAIVGLLGGQQLQAEPSN
jgi:hypothetical protein